MYVMGDEEAKIATVTAVPGGGGASATSGAGTSVLYKFGMSPKLWGLVALVGVGGYFYFKKRR